MNSQSSGLTRLVTNIEISYFVVDYKNHDSHCNVFRSF